MEDNKLKKIYEERKGLWCIGNKNAFITFNDWKKTWCGEIYVLRIIDGQDEIYAVVEDIDDETLDMLETLGYYKCDKLDIISKKDFKKQIKELFNEELENQNS